MVYYHLIYYHRVDYHLVYHLVYYSYLVYHLVYYSYLVYHLLYCHLVFSMDPDDTTENDTIVNQPMVAIKFS